ncbi:2Fe-2S iron-sulfur cluster binding domain-containing protein [Pseudomonas marginalis]|uniref:2Fe-2S iron-sulfur cluster binding domain-containing protein n=1 Tax=Pseudomonas marginalis TaxID=298 RepID=A0A9X9FWH6_PSEMA|nr:2Fe-2S iron-sulfur cluster-binding protein [Pseudomonas marginalis]TWR56156.1 2Fe-2S iron-sulfur cluster binding domain-containing protein [Pseudomonas marginalis]SEB62067.1 ferredoxin, 2Fe-2S [Pseudomonas marginalis]
MPSVIFIEVGGTHHTLEVAVGQSLMQAALDNSIPGIFGDCGGSCTCATCHAYLDPAWARHLPAITENEQGLLEVVMNPNENSRLTCQVIMTPELEGLIVRLPNSQG